MAVKVRVPTPLMKLTDNKSEVTADGSNITEILNNLESQFTGIKELDELPASDVLTNHQIDDWMRRSEEEPEEISDEDVGLSKEPRPDELPLDEKFVEVDWQLENAESDAAPD